jgi:hypothetical protein
MLTIFSIYGELYFLISLLLLIFLVIPYAILIVVVIWVYRDAKRKGLNAVVWVIIVWITPFFIGLIFYMIIDIEGRSFTLVLNDQELPTTITIDHAVHKYGLKENDKLTLWTKVLGGCKDL